jgi:hypothetical protein
MAFTFELQASNPNGRGMDQDGKGRLTVISTGNTAHCIMTDNRTGQEARCVLNVDAIKQLSALLQAAKNNKWTY